MTNLNQEIAKNINVIKEQLAVKILQKHFEINPELKSRYKVFHRKLYIEDTCYHLSYLAGAISSDSKILFVEYLSWVKTFFSNLNVNKDDLATNFLLIRDELALVLNEEMLKITNEYLDEAIQNFNNIEVISSTFIKDENPLKENASKYLEHLINGNRKDALELVMSTFNSGVSIKELYLNLFQPVQREVGRLWQLSKLTVVQEHFITAATQLIMSQLYTYLFTSEPKDKKIIVACAQGELHELGARMVADLFELEGWDSYYYGANTPIRSIVQAINTQKPDVLAISVTMTYNIENVKKLIELVREDSTHNNLKIIVGGYPFNLSTDLWKNIGADGSALDAISAIKLANELVLITELSKHEIK